MKTSRTVVCLAVLGFLLTSAGSAFAFWVAPTTYAPTNYALARAGSLLAPTAATATANSGSAITVGWTAPAGQVAGAQYRVTRSSGAGSPTTVCTVASTTTSCQDTGLTSGSLYGYAVRAVLSGWDSSPATASATTTQTQQGQTITFTSTPPAPGVIGRTYGVTATATSGLAVTFSLDATSSGCSIAGATVTFTAAGTCKVNADQAGNAAYLAAPRVQQSITVTAVTGMVWSNVKVNGTAVPAGSITCTGTIGTTYSCSVNGGNNDTVTANVVFANASGAATVYSSTAPNSTVNLTATGKTAGSSTVTINAGATTSTGTATAQKNGSNPGQVTATFNGFTAVLVIN
jgi:hypothetical protein